MSTRSALNRISPQSVGYPERPRGQVDEAKRVGRRFMKRIAIVDDHKLFSAGLQLLLSDLSEPVESEVFDQPKTFLAEIQSAGRCHDLVALDFYIPGYLAADIIREL